MHKVKRALLSAGIAFGLVLAQVLFPMIAFAGTDNSGSIAGSPTKPLHIAGSDRYQTAAQIAEYGWKDTADNAILAVGSDDHLVDALAAAPLAAAKQAPILLTEGDTLNPYTSAELKRLKVKTVFLVTGLGVVSRNVVDSLAAINIKVEVLGGSDRFSTALNIAKLLGAPSQVALVTAQSNADALLIAPVAAAKGMPILLTEQNSLPPAVTAYLAANKATIRISYVMGGFGAISNGVSGQLPNPVRLAGTDRYDTNLAVLRQFANLLKPKNTYVVSGDDAHLVDALTGAPLAALSNSLLLLADESSFTGILSQLNGLGLSNNVIGLGGSGLVTDSMLQRIQTGISALAPSDDGKPQGGNPTVSHRGDRDNNPPGWQSGGNYYGSVNELSDGTYGPGSGTFTVNGDMLLGGGANTSLTLQNVNVTGTLTLNPGAGGTVALNNVHAGNIVVQSGASHSIELIGVTVTGTLTVNAPGQQEPVRIVTSGATFIANTVVQSSASLVNNSTGGNGDSNNPGNAFGDISMNMASSNQTVTLEGSTSISSSITVEQTSQDLSVVTAGAAITGSFVVNATATIVANSPVTNIQAAAPVNLQGTSTVSQVTAINSSANVSVVSGTLTVQNVTLQASVTLTAATGATVSSVQIDASGIQPTLAGSFPNTTVTVASAANNATVILTGSGTTVGAIIVNASVTVNTGSGTTVQTVTAAADVTLAGDGTINQLAAAQGTSGISVSIGSGTVAQNVDGNGLTVAASTGSALENAVNDANAAANSLNLGFASGDTASSVTQNLSLPTSVSAYPDVSIIWASGDPAVLSNGGTVTRPLADTAVTLTATVTATVTSGSASVLYTVQKQFSVTVLAQPSTPPAALSITTTSLPSGTIGAPYSATINAAGGTPGYKFTENGTTLSAMGLSLSNTGSITGTVSNSTTPGAFNVTIDVADSSTPALTASQTFTLAINPALSITTTSLPSGTIGAPYSATINAAGGTPGYTFTENGTTLSALGLSLSNTGSISGTVSNSTTPGAFKVTVEVVDSSTPALTASQTFTLTINPALSITTTSLPSDTIGAPYSATINASGGTPGYTFTENGTTLSALGLSLSNTGDITGTVSNSTTPGEFNVTIDVADSSQPAVTTSQAFTLMIHAASTTPAALSITTKSLPSGTIGSSYSATINASGGTPGYTFTENGTTLSALGLSLSNTGIITGTVSNSTTPGAFNVTIDIADSSTPELTASQTFTLAINAASTTPAALSITTTSLPSGTIGAPYSATINAAGGTPGYTFTENGTTLSALGLSLSNTGDITGTVSNSATPGAFSVTINVTDSSQPAVTTSQAFTLMIHAASTTTAALSITTTSLPDGQVGTPYSAALSAQGGTRPYTFTVADGSATPPGLALSSNGILSGIPTSTTSAAFTISVTDSNNTTTSAAITLIVTPPALNFGRTSLPDAYVNNYYSTGIDVIGGSGNYTYSLTSGTVPDGLALDSSTGVIFGIPTSTTSAAFTLNVADTNGSTTSAAFTLIVNGTTPGALTMEGTTMPNGVMNVPYAAYLTGVGGSGGYHFAVSSGIMPDGLLLNASTGLISGIPTSTTSAAFTVTLTDSSNSTTSAAITLTIVGSTTSQALQFSTSGLPAASHCQYYSAGFTVTGGTAPYTYSLASGSLPPGLTLNDGVLQGIPTETGTWTFVVQATDSSNPANSVTQSVTLLVQ